MMHFILYTTVPALLSCGALCQLPGTWEWRRVPGVPLAGLGGTDYGMMSFDVGRARGVSWGGELASSHSTFEWDGSRWRRRVPPAFSPAVPPMTMDVAMAWDPSSGKTLLFGAWIPSYTPQTWLWDGSVWAQAMAPGPSPRTLVSMATDPVRQRVVLYGGWFGGLYTDTWEWDGSQWAQIQPLSTTPTNGGNLAMAWNPVTQRVALFGGNASTTLAPVHEWDGADWVLCPAVGSPTVTVPLRCRAVSDPLGAGVRIYTLGSITGPSAEYFWDGAQLVHRSTFTTPCVDKMFSDTARGEIVALGCDRSTWVQDPVTNAWSVRSMPDGYPSLSQIEHLPWRDAYFAAGGSFGNSGLWLQHDRGYEFLSSHYPAVGPSGWVKILVHPGTREIYCQDFSQLQLWKWNGTGWTLSPVTLPHLFEMTIAGTDSRDGAVVCYSQGTRAFHKWDGSTFSPFAPPPNGISIALHERFAFDTDRFILLFHHNGAIWEWDGVSWASHWAPTIQGSEGLAFVPGVGTLLLTDSMVWIWDGATWAGQPTSTRAGGGGFYSAQYDALRDKVRAHIAGYDQIYDLEFRRLTITPEEPSPGATLQIQVDSPPHAGQPWVLGMAWESWPGIPLGALHPTPGRVLPLSPDDLFQVSLSIGLSGFLDASGRAQKNWVLPADPSLSGLRLFACAVSITPQLRAGLVSNAVEVYVLP